MAISQLIEAEAARAAFDYDPRTGTVTRKTGSHRATIGPIVGRDNGDGYSRVTLLGQRIYLHRLAWLLHYGEWPKNQVDHIDGNRANNAASNLRDVSHTANAQNVHVANSNTGLLGVWYDKSRNKFLAQISVGPRASAKVIHLGRYTTAEDAHAAYLTAKAKYHPSASIAA